MEEFDLSKRTSCAKIMGQGLCDFLVCCDCHNAARTEGKAKGRRVWKNAHRLELAKDLPLEADGYELIAL
jgi:hypothetical protein